MPLLDLAFKPDAEEAYARMEAWWNCAVLDRPALQVTAPRPAPKPLPEKRHASLEERWLDVEYTVVRAAAHIANTYWAGEILPQFWPNLGPEVLTGAFGAPLIFGEDTSWSVPILKDWGDLPSLAFDPCNRYVQAVLAMTRLSLEVGRGKFITGITDLHPGADLAASLRDPQQLCIDVATEPDRVRELMAQLRPAFYQFYDLQYRLLREAGQEITSSWLPVFTKGRCYIPSADLACMVSCATFRDLFLEEIREEVAWLDRSIFHLDGPGALRHLDTLLEIDGLHGIQFVCGAAAEPSSRWMEVFRRIQAAGKCMHVTVEPQEVDLFVEALRPEGVLLCTTVRSPEEADSLIHRVARWPGRKRQ